MKQQQAKRARGTEKKVSAVQHWSASQGGEGRGDVVCTSTGCTQGGAGGGGGRGFWH